MAKKNKSRQKKFDTRIDFTPMVDMNMLLITFFMLCTTMLKSQTLDLVLPTNENVNKEEETKIKESDAITFILDGTVTTDKMGQAKPTVRFTTTKVSLIWRTSHSTTLSLVMTKTLSVVCSKSVTRNFLPRLTN